MARHGLVTGTLVAEAQAAAIAAAAPLLHDPEYRRMPPPSGPGPPPCPGVLPRPDVFPRPLLSMSRTAKAKEESPSPARSASGLRTYGSSPSSGERTPQLPRPTDLDDAVDYEARDSEDEKRTATKGTARGTELDGDQAPPPQLSEIWTSLSVEAQAAIIRRWSDLPGLGEGTRPNARRQLGPTLPPLSGLLLPPTTTSMSPRTNGS